MYFVDSIEKQWMEQEVIRNKDGEIIRRPYKYIQQKTNRKGEKIFDELSEEIYYKWAEKGYSPDCLIKIFCGKDGYWRYVVRIPLETYYQRPLHPNCPETFWEGTIWEGWEDYWKEEAEEEVEED